jgi:hypothetical protein
MTSSGLLLKTSSGLTFFLINLRFELVKVSDSDGNAFNMPVNLKRFRFEYDHSEFFECDRSLAIKNRSPDYSPNFEKNNQLFPGMIHITEYLTSIYRHYWLAGGTLLGWYRDCGVIPHTTDIDFGIWSREYEPEIRQFFLGNEYSRLGIELGLRNDSYELRLVNQQFTFDLFLVYPNNETHDWCGYQVRRRKYM